MAIAQIFWFCNSNFTTFPTSRKCKNFNFSFYTVRAEMLYLQKYLTHFEKLFLAERWGRWLFWLKISCAQIFWFCNSNVTTFPKSPKVKFQFFPLHCPGRNTTSSKVFNEFSKTLFGWKTRKVGILVENCNCRDILVLQQQLYNFSNTQKM